jgi:hypothetical protein
MFMGHRVLLLYSAIQVFNPILREGVIGERTLRVRRSAPDGLNRRFPLLDINMGQHVSAAARVH